MVKTLSICAIFVKEVYLVVIGFALLGCMEMIDLFEVIEFKQAQSLLDSVESNLLSYLRSNQRM